MATYSQTAMGYVVGGFNLPATKIYNIPDTDISGESCTGPGGFLQATQDADLMLVKGPDDGLAWYRYDAERSTPTNPILVKVY